MLARRDDLFTLSALGLIAYVTADLAHHLLGHGTACLLAHGRIVLLSSIVLKCSVQSAAIDLAGPGGSLALGLIALPLTLGLRGGLKLLGALVAAFNFFWFFGQMVLSLATRTDDWVWTLNAYGVGEVGRVLLIGIGVAGYLAVVRVLAVLLAEFATSRERMRRICLSAWLAAAALAALTAALDANSIDAVLKHGLPQGLLSPLGLLLVPARAVQHEIASAPPIERTWPWIALAVLGACFSVVYLGPGISV